MDNLSFIKFVVQINKKDIDNLYNLKLFRDYLLIEIGILAWLLYFCCWIFFSDLVIKFSALKY